MSLRTSNNSNETQTIPPKPEPNWALKVWHVFRLVKFMMYINWIFENIFYCSVIEYIWPLKDYSKTFCWYWVKMRYDDNPVSISGHRDSINRRNSSMFLFSVMLAQLEKNGSKERHPTMIFRKIVFLANNTSRIIKN